MPGRWPLVADYPRVPKPHLANLADLRARRLCTRRTECPPTCATAGLPTRGQVRMRAVRMRAGRTTRGQVLMRAVQSVRCECSRHTCARCQDALHLTPTRARVPPPRQRRAETAHSYPAPPHQVTSHRARPRHQRADQRQASLPGSPLIHNPSIPFHAILPCHVMCSFEPTSSGITASNL